MKTTAIIGIVLSLIMLFSITVCGLWIRGQANVDQSSIRFHGTLGILTAVAITATLVLSWVVLRRLA